MRFQAGISPEKFELDKIKNGIINFNMRNIWKTDSYTRPLL